MSPGPRAAIAVVVVAVAALFVPVPVVVAALLALAGATLADALIVRRAPVVEREVPSVLARGVGAPIQVTVDAPWAGAVRVRQPLPPDVRWVPAGATMDAGAGAGEVGAREVGAGEAGAREAGAGRGSRDGTAQGTAAGGRVVLAGLVVADRRGRHHLGAVAVRTTGPLGLGRWDHRAGGEVELRAFPDLPGAYRLLAVRRQQRWSLDGRARGPLGLGTELESVRDYQPDDDVRQINWPATSRLQRPMSNQYRVERDRAVVCVVDAGRLMAAPVGSSGATRLDLALDAVASVAVTAEDQGDRIGAAAFDDRGVSRRLSPRHRGARQVVEALFDLEPVPADSDYELALRTVASEKRCLVIVLTDLVDAAAAQSLVRAVPVLGRRHSLVVASATDPDLAALLSQPPVRPLDVYGQAVALDALAARAEAARHLAGAGAVVVEASPGELPAACVNAYLRLKQRARV